MSLLEELVNGPSAAEQYLSMAPMLGGGLQAGALGGGYGPTPTTGGNPRAWVTEALDITNSPLSWRRPLMELMRRESGGDPNAYNDTPVASGEHAQGLFQTIPSTFEAHDLPRLGGINDPVSNAVAAIRYIIGRYGSPFNLPESGGY